MKTDFQREFAPFALSERRVASLYSLLFLPTSSPSLPPSNSR